METIGKYTVFFMISLFISALSAVSGSEYLRTFFAQNAILLGGTIFTIHAAGVGILMSQLQILIRSTGNDFSSTIKSIRRSFIEASILLMLIMVTAITMTADKSFIIFNITPFPILILETMMVFFVTALLGIVYDTVDAILKTLDR